MRQASTAREQPISEILQDWDEQETWAQVPDWPTYEVSSWGRVYRNKKILKVGLTRGYEFVSLSDRGEIKLVRVHRLVLEAFYGPPPFEGAIAAHNDGDRRNNRISNLRWASLAENQADRERHGTKTRGSDVHNSKLTESDIPTIRERIVSGERYPRIAADYGVSISTISLIKKNRIWKHV